VLVHRVTTENGFAVLSAPHADAPGRTVQGPPDRVDAGRPHEEAVGDRPCSFRVGFISAMIGIHGVDSLAVLSGPEA
jgi:hypothetical protein